MSTITTSDNGVRIGCDECAEPLATAQALYNHTEQTGHTTYAERYSRTSVHHVSDDEDGA